MSLSTWKSRVKAEHKQKQIERKSQMKNLWRENWNTCSQNLEDAVDLPKIKWPTVKAPKSNKSSICTLKECAGLPAMSNWVLTPRSCLVEKEGVLFNIPFLNHEKDEDNKFVKELLKSYEGNVDGKQKLEILDNEMLVELVESLQRKYAPNCIPPQQIIFEAISKCFPYKATPEQLKEKYLRLTAHQEGKAVEVAEAPNSCEHALKTFKKYFCRRCFLYNCDLHGDWNAVEDSSNIKLKSALRIKTPVESCGSCCYKLLQTPGKTEIIEPTSECSYQSDCDLMDMPSTSKSAALMAKMKLERDSNLEKEKAQLEWLEDEKTLFQVLSKAFQNKYCLIAKTMLTKTCQQVYEFAQREGSSVTTEASFQPKTSSQRRKPQKGWRLYGRKQIAQKDAHSTKIQHYFPCNHPGKSCENQCSCVEMRNACEKYCHCSPECSNRFRGCYCRGRCKTNKCPCFAFGRECDPDLCMGCGAAKYDLSEVECKNISIQRSLRKHLLLAPSDVAGWGIFLKDGAEKDDFISEYVGEIISQEEADRRGRVYDKKKCSFLFELNEKFVVDATYKGSKIRFANHSINPNCYAKVMMVLGSHRIGVFAKRDILPGEELFFDYRYDQNAQLKFVSIERDLESS